MKIPYERMDQCCCGHVRGWHDNGRWECKQCRSCFQFHGVGDGHSRLSRIAFVLFLVVIGICFIIGAGIVAYVIWVTITAPRLTVL